MEPDEQSYQLTLLDIKESATGHGYHAVKLLTSRGQVTARSYQSPGARAAALCVGGVGGGWDSPAHDLYPRLCAQLLSEQISALRVRYRRPASLKESALDVLAGVSYLLTGGAEAIALIGHSFGGAVVIQAAASEDSVRTVVTLATQSFGVTPVVQLAPHCSILLLHGAADRVLPPSCSEFTYQLAQEPRRLLIFPDAGHGLDEVADEVERQVRAWVIAQLRAALG